MALVLDLTIPGNPHPKERPRMAKGRTITPAKTLAAEAIIAHAARKLIKEPVSVPVRLTIHFHRADLRQCDIDNLTKTVMDALNGIAYTDDHLVVEFHGYKAIGVGKDAAETRVLIETL